MVFNVFFLTAVNFRNLHFSVGIDEDGGVLQSQQVYGERPCVTTLCIFHLLEILRESHVLFYKVICTQSPLYVLLSWL